MDRGAGFRTLPSPLDRAMMGRALAVGGSPESTHVGPLPAEGWEGSVSRGLD